MWKALQALAIFAAGAGVALAAAALTRDHSGAAEKKSSKPAISLLDATEQQLWTCGMHPQVVQDHPGACPICHMKLTPMHRDGASAAATAEKKKILYWWDPMLGPASISDKPGKSAMGMDLVPVYADAAGPGVHIDSSIVQNMGVRTAVVGRGPLSKTIRTIGLLRTPEPGLYEVSVKIAGWIDKLDANEEGMHIHVGDPLFELYSQDLQVAEEELIAATKSDRALAADTSPVLRKEGNNLIESARRKLRLWDVADEDIDVIARSDKPPKDVPFRSPATGHMVEKMVVQGTAVQPGMKLMRIEDHSKMWLDAQVYEDQFPLLKVGQEVQAIVDGIPGKTFHGTISFISPHLDHMSRTFTGRVVLDNPDFELRPGMYATVEIVTRPLEDALQIPREAVIDTGTRQIVFVDQGDGHFDPRNVRMGIGGDNDRVQIVEGLALGETVVTSGQFLMDVESRTTEAIDKLRRSTSPDKAAAVAHRADHDVVGSALADASTLTEQGSRPGTIPSAKADAPQIAQGSGVPESPTPAATSQPLAASHVAAAGPLAVTSQPATAPPSAMDMSSHAAMTPDHAMQPAFAAPPEILSVAHCGMRKADWLQRGGDIANPYLGSAMLDCGSVTKKLPMPAAPELAGVVSAYLETTKTLAADRFNAGAVGAFKTAIDRLPSGKYADLRAAASPFVAAQDVDASRKALSAVSTQLIQAVAGAAK